MMQQHMLLQGMHAQELEGARHSIEKVQQFIMGSECVRYKLYST